MSDALRRDGATVVGLDIAWSGATSSGPPVGTLAVGGDVRDTDLVMRVLAEHRIDSVIHLAAQTLVGPAVIDPVDTFRNNIEGTWSLLEACRGADAVQSVVVASSDKAYGKSDILP